MRPPIEHVATNQVILVGTCAATRYAYEQLLAKGHKVQIEQHPMSRDYVITAQNHSIELIKVATEHYYHWSPSTPKPKHHNGRYNPGNRKKNKAARKARKQNRK